MSDINIKKPLILLGVFICLLVLGSFFVGSARGDDFDAQVQNVTGAVGKRFQTRDDASRSMDTLKIRQTGAVNRKYAGVYHNGHTIYIAISNDLLTWTGSTAIISSGTQPTLTKKIDGSYLVMWESDINCGGSGTCLAIRSYTSLGNLLIGNFSAEKYLLRSFSSCNEGTPNIYKIRSPDDAISIGFHYNAACTGSSDSQARGILTADFQTWTPVQTPGFDGYCDALGAIGNHGDRDEGLYLGDSKRLMECNMSAASPTDFSQWRLFRWSSNDAQLVRLNPVTPGGSTSFGNPTFSNILLPDGTPGIVVTLFIFGQGAGAGESGELVYFFRTTAASDPVIAAAGDIACPSAPCQSNIDTAALLAGSDNVLSLGDNQYDNGSQSDYLNSYNQTWGQYKSITKPSPGNHDPCSSYYGTYFPQPNCNYSYDLGNWHLVSLDSNNISNANTFLQSDVSKFKQCTLAYWHHPRFSSGATHGNDPALDPIWQTLYANGADLVLNGHDHTYERFAPQDPSAVASANGIREFVVGTGGRSHYSIGTIRANSQFRDTTHYGVIKLTLHQSSYDWKFIATGGAVIDQGTDQCLNTSAPSANPNRAFADTSVWNTPASQKGTPTSNNPYSSTFTSYSSTLEVTKDTVWSKPFCYADGSEPSYIWRDINGWVSGDIRYGGEPIPLPAGCQEATGSDGHLAIITADRHYSYEFWRASVSSKTAESISRFDISTNGTGVPSDTSDNTSARGSGTPLYDTVVRLNDDYEHATGITIPGVQSSYVTPPATHSDGSCSSCPKYGMLFVLRSDYPIPTSSCPQLPALIQQLKTYGAYIVDQGASMGIDAQPGSCLPGSINIVASDWRMIK